MEIRLYHWSGLEIFGCYVGNLHFDGNVIVMAKNVEEARMKIIQKFGKKVKSYIKCDPTTIYNDIIAFYSDFDGGVKIVL